MSCSLWRVYFLSFVFLTKKLNFVFCLFRGKKVFLPCQSRISTRSFVPSFFCILNCRRLRFGFKWVRLFIDFWTSINYDLINFFTKWVQKLIGQIEQRNLLQNIAQKLKYKSNFAFADLFGRSLSAHPIWKKWSKLKTDEIFKKNSN